jgi:alkylated DNA repair dioxygenase AlkB
VTTAVGPERTDSAVPACIAICAPPGRIYPDDGVPIGPSRNPRAGNHAGAGSPVEPGGCGGRYEHVFVYTGRAVTTLQPSLFEADEVGLRPLDDSVQRTELGDGAWVELRRDWLTRPGELFERLLETVPWQAEQRVMYGKMVAVPRLVCFFEPGSELPDPLLHQAMDALSARYGQRDPFQTVGCCLYRAGRDSVAWHGDRIGRGADQDTVVAIVSLGAARRFLLRPRAGGTPIRFDLGGGDLLVMGGSCQRTWEHTVPKTARAVAPRISVQFRPADVR